MSASSQTAVIKPSLSRRVTAVLGPTNTGKTHLAIERMLGHQTGMIGLPLRLLAREIYDKIVSRIGAKDVALITGEEKIKPERPRFYVCTVEAMPRDVDVDFLAIDEIQLAADFDRGHVFTNRLLHARGQSETLLLGAATMAETIRELIPGANFISRPRLSKLSYAGQKKITRLPARSAIVAFSASDVYAIAELIRRQRGGAAVVLGALSPRTRNAQVALYQSGDVDFLVATDAVGMGLNLNVDHIAFAGTRKFDGRSHRDLTPAELGQIAGRAGRHLNDGTFGVTADMPPFDQELVNKLENHEFEPVKVLQWRNSDLDFASIDNLKESLRQLPGHGRLMRARTADDVEALEFLGNDPNVREIAHGPAAVKQLWEVCQVPDYRKVAPSSHAELVGTVYKFIMSEEGVIPEDWFAAQVEQADKTDGDIDTLSNRIAHIRTWTFVSNRREWLNDPDHWQGRTRDIEDRLSDALHDQLTQRFIDKRTSALIRAQDRDNFFAEIEKDGNVMVERHKVGRLDGFRFTPDTSAADLHGKAVRNAAAKVLVHELAARADRLAAAPDSAFSLSREGQVIWENQEIGRLVASDDPLHPAFVLNSDEHLAAADKENITRRIEAWVTHYIEVRLRPLVEVGKAEDVTGLARGIAFRLRENLGILRRDLIADEVKALDQEGRAQLRKYGVRFGAHNIYFPLLLKPASADLLLLLWLLKNGPAHDLTPAAIAEAPRQGLTSLLRNPKFPDDFYRAAGFHICGPRAVRIDILERLADIIRSLTSWKPTEASSEPPPGATGNGAFRMRPEMMSIMGCSSDELALVLEALGFRKERRPVRKEAGQAATDAKTAPEEAATAEAGGQAPAANDNQEGAGKAASSATLAAGTNDANAEPSQAAEQQGKLADDVKAQQAPSDAPEDAAPAEADATATAEPDFEEVWRFRRPKPKTEYAGGERQGQERRAHGRDRSRPRHGQPERQRPAFGPGTSAQGPQGGDSQQSGWRRREGDGAAHGRGDGGRRDRDQRQGQPPRDQRPAKDVSASGELTQAQSLAQGEETRAADSVSKPREQTATAQSKQHHHGRGEPRRDRPQGGKGGGRSAFTATASPKKPSAGIDPDSPFAALSGLKERLEKQMQAQE